MRERGHPVQGSGLRAALSLQIKVKLPQGWCVSTTVEVPSEEALLARRRSSISYMSHVEQGQEPPRSSCNGPHGGVVCHRRRWDISPQPTVLWRHRGQIDKWKWFPICQKWKCDGHLWKVNFYLSSWNIALLNQNVPSKILTENWVFTEKNSPYLVPFLHCDAHNE